MPTDIGGGIGSPPDANTNTQQTGSSLTAWANALAASQDISVDEAKKRITKYIAANPGTTPEAAARALNAAVSDPSTTGSSDGSSDGSSSGSVAAGPSPQDLRNAQAAYESILTGWGIPLKPAIRTMIAGAVKQGVSTTAFIAEFRKTKLYAQRFQGIMRNDGTMRMTEAQYLSGYESARDAAAQLGRPFSREMYGLAIKNGNSVNELRDKLEAADKLKTIGPMLNDFSGYLMAIGAIKKPLTRQDSLKFILGEAPKQFYDAYRTAQAAAQVEELGFQVGKPASGADIGYRELGKIAAQMEVLGQQGDYAGLLAAATNVVGAGEWEGLGITKKDKVRLALGAPGSRDSAAKLQKAVAIKMANLEPRANPDIVQSSTGTQMLGGAQKQQLSE